ncbi:MULTISPECIES: hypothetical protein [Varibaculum]|uniref:hypothetical protein n=1 Tax=Varibaculum TaxID=184869 RepID=UPI00116006D0|nr:MULTISPECIES: hypothetical protein [Varibaculum]
MREITNPAELTRDILRYQSILTGLAKTPTEQLLAKTEETREKRKTNSPSASKPTLPKKFRAQIGMRHHGVAGSNPVSPTIYFCC